MDKNLLLIGLVIIAIGCLVVLIAFLSKAFQLFHLSGDIMVQKGHFSFYFPIESSIILSVVLTLILNLILRFLGKT